MPKRSYTAPSPTQDPRSLLDPLEPRVLLSTLDPANPIATIQTDQGEIVIELYARGASSAAAADAQEVLLDIFDGRLDRATWQDSGGELSLILSGEVMLGFDESGMIFDRLGGSGSPDALGCVVTGLDVLTELRSAVTTPSPFAVRVIDIEVTKPEDGAEYTHILAYPEGYRADTVDERIQLTNVSASPVDYQIIARFERGWRDQVLAFGTLDGTSARSISLSDPSLPAPGAALTANTSRLPWANLPYAIEIHASGAIGASFQHEDFGAEIGEDFFVYAADGAGIHQASRLREWSIAGVNDGASTSSLTRLPFLLLYNPTARVATVTIDFYHSRTPNNPALTVTQTLGPYRRGGLEIFSLLGTNQLVSIDVDSNVEVLAALTSYEQQTSAGPMPVLTESAVGSMLSIDSGVYGFLPGVRLGPGYVYFMQSHPQLVTSPQLSPFASTSLVDSSGQVRPFPSGLWERIDLEVVRQDLGLPVGEIVTLRYASDFGVRAYYVSEDPGGSGGAVATPFHTVLSEGVIFSGGQLDLTDPSEQELLSIYNGSGAPDEVSLRVFFSDGTSADIPSFMLDDGESITIDLGTLSEITTKLMADPDLTYSLLVTSSGMWVPFAQFTRVDGSAGTAWSSRGTVFGEIMHVF